MRLLAILAMQLHIATRFPHKFAATEQLKCRRALNGRHQAKKKKESGKGKGEARFLQSSKKERAQPLEVTNYQHLPAACAYFSQTLSSLLSPAKRGENNKQPTTNNAT